MLAVIDSNQEELEVLSQKYLHAVFCIYKIVCIHTCMVSRRTFGRTSSMHPRSFENLFNILPDELVLIKNILVLQTLVNMRSCNFFDAFMHRLKKQFDRKNVVLITETIMNV